MGSGKAGSSYDENRGGTRFENDLAAMTKVAKRKGMQTQNSRRIIAE